ncbi:hypothetical protein BFJ63_vAg10891 [Fusarium oxysporum f. sp. narcissi]|uniref:Uncharacterized protein n=1 Tax=Fusarium oxysporum f. sp. narcissi TaxID=451672 RepID=A0A4Q2VID5_FUSOX|nr:hypothetical protein BFJ63_vAg10891 [Fusarium oxysporum f. sp. narcissi]
MPSVTGTAYHLGSAAQVLEPVLVDQCREVLLVHLRHVESAPNRVSLALVFGSATTTTSPFGQTKAGETFVWGQKSQGPSVFGTQPDSWWAHRAWYVREPIARW